MGIWKLGGDIQGVPENMRHNDFFTSYMRIEASVKGFNKIQIVSH